MNSPDFRRRFFDPNREFSPVPFWFLNGNLTEAELRRQLEDFRAHGVWGVTLHPRKGLAPEIGYMSPRWLDLIAFAVEAAKELGMFVFLYDEGMYPSGSCHGQVVRENPAYAARGLRLTETPPASGRPVACVALRKTGEAAYDPDSARLLADGAALRPGETAVWLTEDFSHGTIRGLFPGEDDGEPDAPPAADLLNPEATACFIRLTHERYYARMPRSFGTTIRAFFTDEPNPLGRCAERGMRPWTRGLEKNWLALGRRLEELPALFWDAGEATDGIRQAFDALIDRRLLEAFYGPLQCWCRAHGVALTGHPARADAFCLEEAFDVPGQDLVWRFVAPGERAVTGPESTQAHCAADSARRAGKRRNLNECFGCCGPEASQWGMTLSDMKWMLDYLFVRGTNLIVPHAFHYALDVVDRPPDVGPHSPWWPHFSTLAAYIARLCCLNTDGESRARVAVLARGPRLPWRAARLLLERQIDFHYVAREDDVSAYAAVVTDELTEAEADALRPLACASLNPPSRELRAAWRVQGSTHVFLLTNEGETVYEGRLTLPVAGPCERWDAWSGVAVPLGRVNGPLSFRLESRQSVVLAVDPAFSEHAEPPAPPASEALRLSAFTLTDPDGCRRPLPALVPWQELPGLETFDGTLVYETSFTLARVPARLLIDLGGVRELAVLSLNGGEALPLLLSPFMADVTRWARAGENRLRVEVTSSFVTRHDGLPWPCGLLGPVEVRFPRGKT